MARVKKAYKIITFATTTAAMAMESYCLEKQLPGRLIPVPQEISSGCGVAWRVAEEDFYVLEAQLWNAQLAVESIVDLNM